MYLDTERRMEFLHKSLLFNLHHKSIQIHFQLLTQIPHTAALTLWGFIIANNQMYQRHKYIYHFFLVFILIWFPLLNKYNQTFTMEITKLEHSTLPSYPILKSVVKLREREGQGVDPGRSLKGHYRWWMVDGGYPFPDALH